MEQTTSTHQVQPNDALIKLMQTDKSFKEIPHYDKLTDNVRIFFNEWAQLNETDRSKVAAYMFALEGAAARLE